MKMNPAGEGAGADDPERSSSAGRSLLPAGGEAERGGEGLLAMVEGFSWGWSFLALASFSSVFRVFFLFGTGDGGLQIRATW